MSAAPDDGRASGAATAFPWDEAMAAGFGVLRLSPDVFWRMSPREFAHALSPFLRLATDAPTRGAFETLAARFPDEPGDMP